MRRIVFLPSVLLTLAFAPALQATDPLRIIAAGTGNIADLSVAKNGPVNSAADTNVSFDVTIVNNGPDSALTVSLNDPLPSTTVGVTTYSMTFVSISKNNAAATAFSCTDPGGGNPGTINCTIATLPAGASANFTFLAHIPPGTPAGTTFTNIATASATGSTDLNSENDSGSTAVTVPGTDLSVQKNGPATAPPNANVSYDITVTNGAAAASSVSLKDTLPSPITFVSIKQNNGPAFDCTNHPAPGSGGLVECTISSMTASTSANFTLVGHIPPSTANGTGINNTADVTTTSPESVTDNNESTTSLTVSTVDLGVTKSGPTGVTAGQNITYTISFSNVGTSSTTNARFFDSLPPGTTFVSLTPTGGNVSPSCTTPSVGSSGSVTCTLSSSAPGDNAAYTLVLNVNANVNHGTVLTNTVTAASDDADANASNDSASTSATVTGVTDVSVNKTGAGTVIAGNNLSYSITVTNNGPSLATSTQLSDALPGSTTFVSLIQNSGPVSSCTSPAVGGTGSVTCNWASLASGATANFTLVVKTASSANGTITNTAIVSEAPSDPNSGNNSSTASTTLTASADLAVTKTGPATATPNQNLSYSIVVTNNGPSDAHTVALNDTLPATTTFVSNTQNTGPAFVCVTPAVGATGTVTCTISTLASGASASFTLVAHPTASTPSGTLSNTANVTSASPSDPNSGNNSATASTTFTASADVSVTKTGPTTAVENQDVSYTIIVTNNGPSDAQTVTLSDPLPATTTFVSNTQNSGPAFICVNPSAGSGGTVSCSIATLAGGASATFTLVVHTTLSTPAGPMSNTATVSSASPSDPSPGNNSSTATTGVSLVDLAITKTPQPPLYGTGLPLTWTIVVTNTSATPATAVSVTDVLPVGTTFTGSTPAGACTGTTTITCTAATLNGGASVTFTITVTLPSTPGPVTNIATVSSATTDANPANNTATSTITVIPAANIPAVSPLALLMLCIALAAAGAITQRH